MALVGSRKAGGLSCNQARDTGQMRRQLWVGVPSGAKPTRSGLRSASRVPQRLDAPTGPSTSTSATSCVASEDGDETRRTSSARGQSQVLPVEQRVGPHPCWLVAQAGFPQPAPARPGAPFGDGGAVQAVALGQGAGRFLRRLGLGSNSRRCPGIAVKNCCHSAFFPSRVKTASRLSGTEHLDFSPPNRCGALTPVANTKCSGCMVRCSLAFLAPHVAALQVLRGRIVMSLQAHDEDVRRTRNMQQP